jgi:hypothetical protein
MEYYMEDGFLGIVKRRLINVVFELGNDSSQQSTRVEEKRGV